MPIKINHDGSWKDCKVFIKDNNIWKNCEVFVKDSDIWKSMDYPVLSLGKQTVGSKSEEDIKRFLIDVTENKAGRGSTAEVIDINTDWIYNGKEWENTGLISNRVFNISPKNENADLIQCNNEVRPGCTWHYRNCVFDCRNIPHNEIDEAFSVVRSTHAILENSVIIGAKKAILCGSGDGGDWGGSLIMRNCVLLDCGRRTPEAQQGYTVTMDKCWIHNWGIESSFDVRAFAVWVHDNANIEVTNSIFTRNTGLGSNDSTDIANWIGWYTNEYGLLNATGKDRYGLSGSLRAIEKIGDGNVGASHNYRNQDDFVTGGETCWSMNKSEADIIIQELANTCPDMIPFLGKSLHQYWIDERV